MKFPWAHDTTAEAASGPVSPVAQYPRRNALHVAAVGRDVDHEQDDDHYGWDDQYDHYDSAATHCVTAWFAVDHRPRRGMLVRLHCRSSKSETTQRQRDLPFTHPRANLSTSGLRSSSGGGFALHELAHGLARSGDIAWRSQRKRKYPMFNGAQTAFHWKTLKVPRYQLRESFSFVLPCG